LLASVDDGPPWLTRDDGFVIVPGAYVEFRIDFNHANIMTYITK
jgi:hypothetical protein